MILSLHESVFSQKAEFQNIECISLVTDRSLYLSGEPIWFSASYIVPLDTSIMLSKVLYVELFNNDNQVVASRKIKIGSNLVDGQLLIPEHAETGYYLLRAYTRYQENFPRWQLTSTILSVVNPSHPLPVTVLPVNEERVSVATMPDGNIAFRIIEPLNQEVKSVELFVNEALVNNKMIYYSNGLGRFNHKARREDKIHLLIILNSGDTIQSQTFYHTINPVEITTVCHANELQMDFRNILGPNKELQILLSNLIGRQVVTQNVNLIDGHGTVSFPLNRTGLGLLLISIRDNDGSIIFETFCYATQEDRQVRSNLTESLVYPGEPISIDLVGFETEDYPLVVSLVLKGTHSAESRLLPKYLIDNPLYIEDRVANNMLSGNDISDQINITIAIAIDKLLQLVHTPHSNLSMVVPEINGLTLQGKLIDSVSKLPLQDELIYCSVLGNQPQFHVSRSSADGSFVIPLDFLSNQHNIYLVTDASEENVQEIKINNGFCPTFPSWFPSPFLPDTSLSDLITQMYMNHQVNSIFNISRQQILDSSISNRPIFGDNLNQIKLADYIQMSSTPEVFNELIPFVRARKKDGHYELIVFDEYLNIKYDNPLVLVDQIPYYDIDRLMELQPTEIEQIDVASNVYAYGNSLFNGIIKITTNTGNFAGLPLSKGGVFVEYETLETDVKFIPFSSLPNISGKPNFANTVYWKSFNNVNKPEHLLITAPAGIADYELLIISQKDRAKIIGRQKVRVSKGLIP